MLTDIGHRIQIVILLLSALTSYHVGFGQIPYTYNCRDYVSTDDNRAPQSAFSYNDNANSFTINALPGENNVAFEMNRAKDNAYYINNDCNWMVITGSNVSADSEKAKCGFGTDYTAIRFITRIM